MRAWLKFWVLLAAVWLAIAPAHAQLREDWLNPFDLKFEGDPPGGKNTMGESQRVNETFVNGTGRVVAEYQIEEAYRTEDFGSGVGFHVTDATGSVFLKVGFEDPEGYDNVWFFMSRTEFVDGEPIKEDVGSYELEIGPNEIGSIELELSDDGRLIARSGGAVLEAKMGFEPERVVVQVFCAKGWIRFLDGELTS